MEQKFKLTNVVLYAKGWYLRTDDIWADLQKILELDDYTPFDKRDVYEIIVSAFQKSGIYRITELKEVLNGITPQNSWKYGYYTKGNADWIKDNHLLPEYDMATAFIYYVISNLRMIENKHWTPQMPKVSKYPKSKDVSVRKLYEQFCHN